jgi:hypothetical protein
LTRPAAFAQQLHLDDLAGHRRGICAKFPRLLQQLPGAWKVRVAALQRNSSPQIFCVDSPRCRHAQAVKRGSLKVMLWRPKRGGVGESTAAVDDELDAHADLSSAIDVELRGQLIDILTINRDNLDENDATFRSTTNIRHSAPHCNFA